MQELHEIRLHVHYQLHKIGVLFHSMYSIIMQICFTKSVWISMQARRKQFGTGVQILRKRFEQQNIENEIRYQLGFDHRYSELYKVYCSPFHIDETESML